MNIPLNQHIHDMIKATAIDSLYKKILINAEKKYLIKNLGLEALDPQLVIKLLQRNSERSIALRTSTYTKKSCLSETIWALNEFKVFAWVSVCYAFANNKQLQSFTSEDYQCLQTVFTKKSAEFLQYHLKSFDKNYRNYRAQWSQQQTQLLGQIINDQRNEKDGLIWSQISFRLFFQSEKKYYRTPQKCRQKWFNHLSPEVNHDKWTIHEDLQLFNNICNYGLKWAQISKQFQGSRTEHMIKNRYNSLIKKYKIRSQKHSQRKIIERVQHDLKVKVAKSNHDRRQKKEKMEIKQIKYEEKCIQVTQNEIIDEIAIKIEEMNYYSSQMKLSSLNLQGVLFNETAIEIEHPKLFNGRVQMIEVQMGLHESIDENISTLLF